ncbi:retention module-containing protein, partial [Pectobacterium sp. B1J-3]|uniref:retention module-containing protein n=1 Tax=Pectobacterium sp. B1J-3 TaxID=3385371 RepID=UPI0039064D71
MNNVIGIIKFVIGQVFVISLDGTQRLLVAGDKIYRGEEVITGGDGSVSITLPDGRSLDVGRNSQWSDSGDVTSENSSQTVDEVAALQDAIAQGADPTQVLEATAAGNADVGEAGDGGGSHTAVVLDLTGQIVDPTAGYPTAGIDFATNGIVETDGIDSQSLLVTQPQSPTENNDVITLSSDGRVVEGGKITVTATVNNPVTGSPLVITLTDGSVITIPVGGTNGSVVIDTRDDDAYRQGDEPVNIGIDTTTGGNYTNLDSSSTTTTIVVDDGDVTKITLSSEPTVNEGGQFTVTATVGAPVTGSPLLITLSNGAQITIPVGESSGTVAIDTRSDDAYTQGDEPITLSIDGTSGGNYEGLDTSGTTTTTVVDDGDVTKITLSSEPTVNEGGQFTVTATVGAPVTGSPLLITLSNGAQITIPVGESSGTVAIDTRSDDAYTQGDEPITLSIDGTSGGNYEGLDTSGTTTTTVVDDGDITKITLKGPDSVTEGENITITAQVEHPPQDTDLIIKLTNGQTITIPVGQTEGSVTYPVRGDDALVQGDIAQSVGIDSSSGGNYENLTHGDPVTTTVLDNDVPEIQVSNVVINEGDTGAFNVTFGKPVDNTTTITLKLEHGDTNDADIDVPPVVEIGGIQVQVTVNGDGSFSFELPANTVDGVVVLVPTKDDGVFEGKEHFKLVVTQEGETANGTKLPEGIKGEGTAIITDLDSTDPTQPNPGADVPVLTVGDAGEVNEGGTASFEIALSQPVNNATTLSFTLGGQIDAADIGTPTATLNGQPVEVTAHADGSYSLTVPAGTTGGIVVSVPTVDDGVFEGRENFSLNATLSGNTASGTPLPAGITDSGSATIVDLDSTDPTNPNPGADVPVLTVGDAGEVNEGGTASFEIALSQPVNNATTLSFTLGGQIDAGDIGTPTATLNGQPLPVTVHADGSYSLTVPAGTTGGIVVSVPTVDDGVFEGRENFSLNATLSGSTASGTPLPAGITDSGSATIVDLDSTDPTNPNPGADVPVLTVGDAGEVNEGGTASFEIALSQPVNNATTLSFTLGGQIDAADIGTPTATLNGQPVQVTVHADGS